MFGLILSCGTVVTLMTAGYILQRKGFRGGSKIYATVLGLSALLVFTGAVLALFSGTSFAAEGAAAAKEVSVGAGLGFIAAAPASARDLPSPTSAPRPSDSSVKSRKCLERRSSTSDLRKVSPSTASSFHCL